MLFYSSCSCFLFDFSTITECSDVDETQWDFAFQLCAKHKNKVELLKMLTKALNDVGLPVPDDLASLLSQGLLCTCQQRKATPGKGKKTKVVRNCILMS